MSEQINEVDDPVARFLAAGGKIQHSEYKQSGRAEGAGNNIWSRKPGRPKADAPVITPDIEDKE
jgi:hypothetical protein